MHNNLNLTYYVLHRRPYRESSQIVDLFCERQGRFSALHRVNKKQPALQPFTPYQMQFSGRGDLKYCQHVEIYYPSIYSTPINPDNTDTLEGAANRLPIRLPIGNSSVKGQSLKVGTSIAAFI